jgi:hypothetical protein
VSFYRGGCSASPSQRNSCQPSVDQINIGHLPRHCGFNSRYQDTHRRPLLCFATHRSTIQLHRRFRPVCAFLLVWSTLWRVLRRSGNSSQLSRRLLQKSCKTSTCAKCTQVPNHVLEASYSCASVWQEAPLLALKDTCARQQGPIRAFEPIASQC